MNTAPGATQDELAPGGPYELGLRGTTEDVILGTIEMSVGATDLRFHGKLPEVEESPVTAELHPAERAQPEIEPVHIAITNGRLVFARADGDQFRPCVYEISVPIKPSASLLGYFKFRKKTWATFTPDWCFLPDMTGLYFGLRHGTYNTGCYAFLQAGATPGLVIGGPLQAYQQARPGEVGAPWAWLAAAENTSLEIFIHVNVEGLAAPMSPADYPLVDVWGAIGGQPVLLARLPLGVFGTDPTRLEESFATLFVGNSGQAGDVLELEDWQLFTDFRVAIDRGDPRRGNLVSILPDLPAMYEASSGKKPDEMPGSGWLFDSSGDAEVSESFSYQPGKLAAAQTFRMGKTGGGRSAYYREEPCLGSQLEGFMLEAFLSGRADTLDGVALGTGIEVDDGTRIYRVSSMLTTGNENTYGLHLGGNPADVLSYQVFEGNDYTSLKLVKILGDRLNDVLRVFIDDVEVGGGTLSGAAYPISPGTPRVAVGFLMDLVSEGRLDLAKVNVFNRVSGYEARWNQLPEAAPGSFVLTASGGTESVANGVYRIEKTAYRTPASLVTNLWSYPFPVGCGAFTEFRVSIPEYTDLNGEKLAKSCFTGVGVRLYLSTQVVDIGFYDAGVYGRVVGILPGSGSRLDIIEQTVLGEKFSAQVDWTVARTYRVHVRPGDGIYLWAGSVATSPLLRIPWQGGFDLPELDPTLQAIEFGHFSADESSVSEWEFVRFGRSSGWDVSVSQQFDGGPAPEQFSGKARMLVSFGDGGGGPP